MGFSQTTMSLKTPVLWAFAMLWVFLFAGRVANLEADSIDDRYERATNLFANGQLDLAAEELVYLTKAAPSFAEPYLFLARIYARQNRFDSSAEALHKAIQLKPQLSEAHHLLGVLYLRKKDYLQAEIALAQAAYLAPKNPSIHLDLGNAYMNQDKNPNAVEEFEKVINLGAEDKRVIFAAEFNLGIVRSRAGETAKAAEHFLKAQALVPSNTEVLFSLSALYGKLGQTKELENTLSKLKQPALGSPTLATRFADLLVSLDRESEAVQFLEQARAGSESSELLLKLGTLYYDHRRFQDAEKVLNQATVIKPDSSEVYLALGKTYAAMQDQRAIAAFENSVRLDPSRDEAWEELSRELSKRGPSQHSIKKFESYVGLFPKKPLAHVLLGEAYVNATLLNQAANEYELALALDPKQQRALVALGAIYKETGKRHKAKELLQQALTLDPQSLLANLEMGDILRLEGEYDRAVTVLEEAVKVNPSFAECYLKLGQVYLAMKKFPAARGALTRAAELNPKHAQTHYFLAQAMFGLGSRELADAEYARFRDLERQEQEQMKQTRRSYALE